MTVTASAPMVRPGTVDDVRDAVRDAQASNTPLRISGGDTWTHAGPPVHADRTLSLAALHAILEYVPGDLTITVLAGTTLAEISQATAAHGQWLGLDPAGDRLGTIGATVATSSAGPLAHAFGTPRDLILGLEAITGYGDVVKPGGRVVKNVAGFDLVRLFTGSWGTLGPITSVTLRLRAMPVHDITLAMPVDQSRSIGTLIAQLREPTLSLLAAEWVDAEAARALGIGDGRDQILLRLGGNDAFVRGQRALLESISPCTAVEPGVWGALAALDRNATAVVRVSGAVSTNAVLHGSISRGIVRIIVRGDATAAQTLRQVRIDGEQRIVEQLPEPWWSNEPDVFADGLAGRVRQAFDPSLICNRRRVPYA
jgi:glycolate oxidase FAD binding subunit